ncbi:MAG TPA: transcriptional regulator [Thermodesulfobacteriota bacterium]
MREITRKIDEQINSVRRELANLLNVGVIVSDNTNNKLYYEVNQKFEHYAALKSIFANGEKLTPEVNETQKGDSFKSLGRVDLMLYTGQFTRDESSGIDVLIVGDINKTAIEKYILQLETQEGKDIRYVVMPTHEFNYRRQIKDRFIITVISSKKQIVLDTKSLLEH